MLKSYIAFDLETTGLSPQEHEIIEIGALKVREGKVVYSGSVVKTKI